MLASDPLMDLLVGGVYAAEALPEEGISRKIEATEAAFDLEAPTKPLKACSLVRQRDTIGDGVIMDNDTQRNSAVFVMMVHIYQQRGYDVIDQVIPIIRGLFVGRPYAGVIEIEWFNTLKRARDGGALSGCSLERIDFRVTLVEGD
jgi:hypothetical protein